MKKVHSKNILDRIDDSINDKIDEIKAKNKEKKNKLYNQEEHNLGKIEEKHNSLLDEVDINAIKEKNKEKEEELKEEESPKKDKSLFHKKEDNKQKKPLFVKKDKNKAKKNSPLDEDEISNEEKLTTPKKKFGLFHKKDKVKKEKITPLDEEDIVNDEEPIIVKKKKGLFAKKEKHKEKITKVEKYKKQKGKDKKEKPKKKRSLWKKIVTFILILGILGILSVAGFLAYIVVTCPEYNEDAFVIEDQTVVYDMNGNIIGKLSTEKRESIDYEALPQVLIDAIIATEDSRFFQHNGVDLFRFIKATAMQLLGRDAGGASTLTMQTVKNNLTQKGNTNEGKIEKVIRKFQDVYLAVFKVEKAHSKEEILEMYINDNFLGGSYYGVEEASKYYFGKSASDLTLPEAAIIAGLFQLPGKNNPYTNIEGATKRRNLVLTYMLNHGYITKEEKELAEKIPIESLLAGANKDENKYQGFIDTAVAEIRELTATEENPDGVNPYTTPMLIYTTMNKDIQDGVNSVFASKAKYLWKDDYVQGGVAIVNSETGAIEAIGAGRNRTGINQFNYATQAHRQPGSTAKPVFDYGPGIEYNNMSSYQLFNDEPWAYSGGGPAVGNWDGGYEGLITMRRALQVSRNIPALKAFQQVGGTNSQKFVSSLGLNVSLNTSSENYEVFKSGLDNTINEAYAIGGAAEGFTPLEMANAYACFSNGGYYIKAHSVTKVVYRNTGEEVEYKYTKERVMKDSTAYIMNNILESAVTSGFNGGANVRGSHVAAKTGTSNYDEATMRAKHMPSSAVNDLWTVAYTSKYAVAVWYGYDEISNEHYNDTGTPKDALTAEMMALIPKDTQGWSMPSSVVAVTVEKETWPAMLPSAYTPNDMKITEYFVRGTQPTEVSPRYQKLNAVRNVNVVKGNGNSATITWEYDTPKVLTDSYLESYFNNSVYGNQKGAYLSRRKSYNSDVLGGLVFAIYKKNDNGNLELLTTTTNKSFTYTGYGNATLVIKAEHGKWKDNASDGISASVSLEEISSDKLKLTLNGRLSVQANAGTYQEDGINTVTYNNVDIKSSPNLELKYMIANNDETKEFTNINELEAYVNTLPAGTYRINYIAYYLGVNTTVRRNVTIR